MRLATFNVQNLFERAAALDAVASDEESQDLEYYVELSRLLEDKVYDGEAKERILDLLQRLRLQASDIGHGSVILRQNRGKLVRRRSNRISEVVANGRGDWVGWLEYKRRAVDDTSMWNTARVIGAIDADIMAVVEVEGRAALSRFNHELLGRLMGTEDERKRWRFENIMVIDGNDTRGIDVGVMTQDGYAISFMRSHVHDKNSSGNPLFSRDCPEYLVITPSGQRLWLLVNHFKSQFGGAQKSQHKRAEQAEAVQRLYKALRDGGERYVAVVGDLNAAPDAPELAPLLVHSDLRDIALHPAFDDFGLQGTFGTCSPREKLDYILLSPELFERMTAGGIYRGGLWPGRHRQPRWPVLDTMASSDDSASDHAPIWADIDLTGAE